jgi:hypothetical protein
MALEVGLAEFPDDQPGRVVLLGRSSDPRLVAIVRRYFEGRWPAVVPLPTRASDAPDRAIERRRGGRQPGCGRDPGGTK